MVTLRDRFYDILDKYGLSVFMKIPNESLGTLPSNRGGAWISADQLVSKLRNFLIDGFSPNETKRACALEREPGDVGNAMEARHTS